MTPAQAKGIAIEQVLTAPRRFMANNCCQCKGRRNVQIIGEWEHCPLQDGYHTAFTIYRCNSCGLLRGFPHENLQIAMDRGTDETKHILADYIKKR